MKKQLKPRCLLVAGDFPSATQFAARATRQRLADVVMVPSLQSARPLIRENRFDVVVAECRLMDGNGMALTSEIEGEHPPELLLIGSSLSKEDIVGAVRAGVKDVFEFPLDVDELLRRVCEIGRIQRRRRTEKRRYARLRELSSRIVRDRREVRRRVELVCRDLVGAYQQLAEKVTALESNTNSKPHSEPGDDLFA